MQAQNIFDFIKEMREAGVPERQAEVYAKHLANMIETNLATKDDLNILRGDIHNLAEKINNKIDVIETKLDAKTGSLEARIGAVDTKLNWLVGLAAIISSIITVIGVIKSYLPMVKI